MVMAMIMVKYMGTDNLINIHVREIENNVMIVDMIMIMFMLMAMTCIYKSNIKYSYGYGYDYG